MAGPMSVNANMKPAGMKNEETGRRGPRTLQLALRELEPLASALLTVLLPLMLAGIPR